MQHHFRSVCDTILGVHATPFYECMLLFLLTFTPFGEKVNKNSVFTSTSVKIHILGNKVKNCSLFVFSFLQVKAEQNF